MWFSSLLGLSLVAAAAPSIDQALPEAASRGDLAAIQALLEAETDVDQAQGDGMTALHWAAYRDEIPMAELLLAAEATVDAATRMGGVTPLFLAAKNGSAPMIERLAESGANVNRVTDTGASPLMAAAMSGNVEAIKALLEREADVNGREHHNGQTPLMFAAWENRAEAIRALIAAGAHTELTSNILVLQEDRYDADGNPRPRREGREQSRANAAMGGMTALLFAAREGHMESVRALVEAGADIDRASGSDASTPIVIAIANGHYDVGQYLLDQGADVRAANLDGLTPLYATVNMRYAPVSWAPNPRTDQETVDSLDLMRRILEAGADPNARVRSKLWFSPTSHDRGWVEHNGATPFWRAAMSSDVEAMRVLVQGGADPKLATHDGITPLMVAAGLGWIGNFSQNAPDSFFEAVEYCLELGNDVNAVDSEGFTALHGAAAYGDNDIVRLLVDHGARLDLINEDGDSVADMAFGPSRFFIPKPETVDLLVELGAPFQNNCRSDQCVDGKFNGAQAAK